MKCIIFNCDKEAKNGFQCCSANHGSYLNVIKNNFKDLFKAPVSPFDEGARAFYTIEECEHYSKIFAN